MPFTPYHLGFGVFLFSICPYIDVISILIGTIIIDIEGLLYLLFKIGVPHGFTHSLLGVMIYFLPCAFFSWIFFKILQKKSKLQIRFNWILSILSGLLGLVSHIIFDGSLYPEMMILYPFSTETGHIFSLMNYQTIVILLTTMFFVGVCIIFVKIVLRFKFKINLLLSYNLKLPLKAEEQLSLEEVTN